MEADGTPYVPLKNRAEAADFNRKRRHNALRLKNRFADIIDRYSHDFSDVGDVIDLASEKLVVDNGHLENMRGELDPAYDQIWEDTESEQGDVEFVENEGDIDELCSDMMTEKEKAAVKGVEPQTVNEARRDSPSEVTNDYEQIGKVLTEEEELALVTVSSSTPFPSIGQNVFQAPMFPQLENAVNTMTSMLQHQMMAMLGAVLPVQTAQAILPAQSPRATTELRQILPAQASQPSLKRRFETLTPPPVVVGGERDRVYTQLSDLQSPPSKSYSLKRLRMSDMELRRDVHSMSAPGEKPFSTPIERRTPARAQQVPTKTPHSMPARPQRSMLLRSNIDGQAVTKNSSQSSRAEPVPSTSTILPGHGSSEDELGPSFTPHHTTVTPQRRPSPKVVISARPKVMEAKSMAGDHTATQVAQAPPQKRRRKRKSRTLVTEKDSEGEFLMLVPVDDLEEDSDFKPPQSAAKALSVDGSESHPELRPSQVSSCALSQDIVTLDGGLSNSSRRLDSGLLSDCFSTTSSLFEHDSSSLQIVQPVFQQRTGRRGRSQKLPQPAVKTDFTFTPEKRKVCTTFGAKELPESKYTSATVCNTCNVKDLTASKLAVTAEGRKGNTAQCLQIDAPKRRGMPRTKKMLVKDKPVTIVDETRVGVTCVLPERSSAENNPASSGRTRGNTPATPEQSYVGTGAPLSRNTKAKTVLFALEAEIIPDPEREAEFEGQALEIEGSLVKIIGR